MAFDIQTLEGLLQKAFPDAVIQVTDTRGDANHFAVCVTSAVFKGKSRIAQHKMVYAALEGRAGEEIHALAVQTKIPT